MATARVPKSRRQPGSRWLDTLAWVGLTLILIAGAYWLVVRPWSLRWGATDAELTSALPGDELIASSQRQVTRAIRIEATPEKIWPWLIQIGAGRGGFYSADWFETKILGCPITNAERIEPALQNLKLGDVIRLCPEGSGPPIVYAVRRLDADRALVLGVREGQGWGHTWAFILRPQPDGSTRLLVRSRTALEQGWQKMIEFGEFVMERAMMIGIKTRAER